jgi:hypothetical protein
VGAESGSCQRDRDEFHSAGLSLCRRTPGSIRPSDRNLVPLCDIFRAIERGGSDRRSRPGHRFLALLKGDHLKQDITITGTLEGDGRIGQVAQVAEKTTAAARAGYHVLLVPRGQFYAPRVNRVSLNLESNVLVREVETIEEAYEIMTGKKL